MKFFKEAFKGFDSEGTRRNRGNERPDDEVSEDDEKMLPSESDPLDQRNVLDPRSDPSIPKVYEDQLDDDAGAGSPSAEDDSREQEPQMTSWRAPEQPSQVPPRRGLTTYYPIKAEHLPPPEHEILAATPAKYRQAAELPSEPRKPEAPVVSNKGPVEKTPISNPKGLTPEEVERRRAAIQKADERNREAA